MTRPQTSPSCNASSSDCANCAHLWTVLKAWGGFMRGAMGEHRLGIAQNDSGHDTPFFLVGT
eukprot:1564905-Amphidinium_carterae.1